MASLGPMGKVWEAGVVKVVQDVQNLAPGAHPCDRLHGSLGSRVTEVVYLPVYEPHSKVSGGVVAVLEVMVGCAAHDNMVRALPTCARRSLLGVILRAGCWLLLIGVCWGCCLGWSGLPRGKGVAGGPARQWAVGTRVAWAQSGRAQVARAPPLACHHALTTNAPRPPPLAMQVLANVISTISRLMEALQLTLSNPLQQQDLPSPGGSPGKAAPAAGGGALSRNNSMARSNSMTRTASMRQLRCG